ncbi:unnamed protein product, partial [Polarella glacialis]
MSRDMAQLREVLAFALTEGPEKGDASPQLEPAEKTLRPSQPDHAGLDGPAASLRVIQEGTLDSLAYTLGSTAGLQASGPHTLTSAAEIPASGLYTFTSIAEIPAQRQSQDHIGSPATPLVPSSSHGFIFSEQGILAQSSILSEHTRAEQVPHQQSMLSGGIMLQMASDNISNSSNSPPTKLPLEPILPTKLPSEPDVSPQKLLLEPDVSPTNQPSSVELDVGSEAVQSPDHEEPVRP